MNDFIYSFRSHVFQLGFGLFFDVAFYPGADSVELIGRQEALGGVFPPEEIELIPPFEYHC